MDITLVVMAAGMGSRFGGLKQLTPMGVSGETVAEFSVFDAIRAGFTRVVFIIKPEMEEAFRVQVISKFQHAVRCDLVFQRISDVPSGCTPPAGREKPLGTGHAVWCCRHAVQEPFAVINADDFYGASTFELLHDFLASHPDTGVPHPYCMAAYALRNTVSEFGSVSRGVCALDAHGNLQSIVERTTIKQTPDGLVAYDPKEGAIPLPVDTPVSLNTWGFHPSFFGYIEDALRAFLQQPAEALVKGECYLPSVVESLLEQGVAYVRALPARDRWIGITYAQDTIPAQQRIRALTEGGIYPPSLW